MCTVNEQRPYVKGQLRRNSSPPPPMALLYINDLPDHLDKTIPCMCADDTAIFSAAKDVTLNECTYNPGKNYCGKRARIKI